MDLVVCIACRPSCTGETFTFRGLGDGSISLGKSPVRGLLPSPPLPRHPVVWGSVREIKADPFLIYMHAIEKRMLTIGLAGGLCASACDGC